MLTVRWPPAGKHLLQAVVHTFRSAGILDCQTSGQPSRRSRESQIQFGLKNFVVAEFQTAEFF